MLAKSRGLCSPTARLACRRLSTAAPHESAEEPLSTEELDRKLLEIHTPGRLSNPKWAAYGGHSRARNFAGFHGVFPALLPSFMPSVELVVRLNPAQPPAPSATELPPSSAGSARTHLLYGNRLAARSLFAMPHRISFNPLSEHAQKLDAPSISSDAPYTLVGCTFSPSYSPAMVDGLYLSKYAMPNAKSAPVTVAIHTHLVICNVPSGRLADGEVLLASDMPSFSPDAMREQLFEPEQTSVRRAELEAGMEGPGRVDELRRLYLGYFCFQQRSGRIEQGALPEGRSWPLAPWASHVGLVARGLAFSEVERESHID